LVLPSPRAHRPAARHILPACTAPLVVQQTYVFAVAILAEAVLSFVGVGPPPPQPPSARSSPTAAMPWWKRPG
jgi:peptide/nickel transport system permease protein